ncbi:putative ABC transport system permease protein [Kitasatospora sp. MMS16-BH015]|uniref:ABC transporter permease n=1 Tax=Kitasatospora sp. MMS16-BH015 TaxID=2018025 RepID=UPI000CA0DBC3|nr:FtsX-like permease family protein [Kitasatospora sp. MMS16-BH015]AUG79392.1 putative ABC transport system permease protein [Kitasatospora sp. MMS16-BH015]
MHRTALRNVLAHKGRLLMTALAIMLGTAFVAGTMVFSDTLGQAMKNSYAKSFTDVSVQVNDYSAGARASAKDKGQRSTAKLTDQTVAAIAALPGTEDARGVVTGFTGVADRKGKLIGEAWSAQATNFSPDASGKDPRYPMVEGRGPAKAGEIALDKETAATGGYKVGDKVRTANTGPATDSVLTGVFTTDDPQVSTGASLTLLDTATAQQQLLSPGQFSSIAVKAKPGVTEQALQDAVITKLPSNDHQFTVQTGKQLTDDQTQMIARSTDAMKTMLLAFAGISLFVGIFIIANTFTMLIAQRTKELALLRAVGASRRQVTNSVLVEALLIGLLASVAGLLAGIGIGAGMQALVHGLNPGMPTGDLVVSPTALIVAPVVGVLVTVLSAVLPAVRASRIAPVAAMSSGDQPATQKGLLVRNIIGFLIAGGGGALIAMGAGMGKDGRTAVGLGAGLALIGVFVLLPLLSRPVIALVGPLLAKLAGTPGKLARQNAVRNPRRTAATAAALTIGLTLVSALTVLGASVGGAVDKAVTSAMSADYDVKMANGMTMTPEMAAKIAKAPGVAAASPFNEVYWDVNGTSGSVNGIDADSAGRLLKPELTTGSLAALGQGQALISDAFAKSHGLAVGSALKIDAYGGSKGALTVGGVYRDNAMLAPVLVSNAQVQKLDPEAEIREVMVLGTNGTSAALQQSIMDATGNNPVVQVKTKQEIRDEFNQIITFALNMMYGLLAMSVLVAVLGVINTLAMSVFERKREIGMLRAIGLDRSGVKRMVRLESVVISLFGAAIGVALGCFCAWAVNGTLKDSLTGLTTVLPYGKLALFLALAGLVGFVAALWPARRAAKLDILDSIKTD